MATPHQPAISMTSRQREALIVQLRADRMPFHAIGAQLGIGTSRAHQIYKRACERIPTEALHTVRVESCALADRAIKDLLSIAENPQVSPRTRVESYTAIRGWDESRRILLGANAPQRREVSIISNDAVDAAIKALTDEMTIMEMEAKAAGVQLD